MRSVWGRFPEYHTSADNLDFIRPVQLARTLRVCTAIVDVLENNQRYRNLNPYCEPQLGRRNLYRSSRRAKVREWRSRRASGCLNLSDGEHSLLDIAERSGLAFAVVQDAAELLCQSGLLSPVPLADNTPLSDPASP